MADYRPSIGFLTMAQATERLGVSQFTITRMTKDGKRAVFQDQRNGRVRLVEADDIAGLERPVKDEARR